MHLADFSIGILGESGILASAMAVAVGAALASKLRGEDKVVIAIYGDGASKEGACHETMNLASLWKLHGGLWSRAGNGGVGVSDGCRGSGW